MTPPPLLSASERLFILDSIRDSCRLDGRTRLAQRPCVVLADGKLALTHGSSRVVVNDGTDVICSVKAEWVQWVQGKPRRMVEISVDCSVSSNSNSSSTSSGASFRSRRTREQALQMVLQDLLQDFVVPVETLLEGRYGWRLFCDFLVLSEEGSVLSVASRALRTALLHTKVPHVEHLSTGSNAAEWTVHSDLSAAHTVQAQDCPILMTVAVCTTTGPATIHVLVDPSWPEEHVASCVVAVAVRPGGDVVGVSTLQGSVPQGWLPSILETAVQAAQEVFAAETVITTTESTALLQPQYVIR